MVPFLLLACAPDPGAGKPAAVIVAPGPEPAAPAPAPDAGDELAAPPLPGLSLAVDAAGSQIRAVGAKITATHPIDFPEFEGLVALDGDTVTAVSFAVAMASLRADPPKLAAHLKKEDFFDVDRFPTATFRSTSIAPKAGAAATHDVVGDLTVHGRTQRLAFPATITVTPEVVTAKAEFSIDRRDFGVVYPGKPDDLVKDGVLMQIELRASR